VVAERVTLPLDVVPVHYALELTPDLERLEFTASEKIHVTVTAAGVQEVTLHCREIHVESACFTPSAGGSSIAAEEMHFNVKRHTVKFVFGAELPVGEGALHFKYRGILNGDMAGFYKSSYADVNGTKKVMASTQFEALDARRCERFVDIICC
jgi:Aminopeptidase N